MSHISLKTEIDEFLASSNSELPELLKNVVETCAKDSRVSSWPDLKRLLLFLVEKATKKVEESSDSEEAEIQKDFESIKDQLSSFSQPPFTVQRMCELALDPSVYSTRSKFIHAFSKTVNGISSGLFPSELKESPLDMAPFAGPMAITHPALVGKRKDRPASPPASPSSASDSSLGGKRKDRPASPPLSSASASDPSVSPLLSSSESETRPPLAKRPSIDRGSSEQADTPSVVVNGDTSETPSESSSEASAYSSSDSHMESGMEVNEVNGTLETDSESPSDVILATVGAESERKEPASADAESHSPDAISSDTSASEESSSSEPATNGEDAGPAPMVTDD